MENNEMNSNRPNMGTDGSHNGNGMPKRMSIGMFVSPLLWKYAVTFIIQLILCGVVFASVFTTYAEEHPELNEYFYEDTELDVYDYFTTEVLEELTLQLYDAVVDYIIPSAILSSLAVIPIFLWLMRRDKKKYNMGFMLERQEQELWKYTLIVLGSITLCIALNNIITLSQLAEVSNSYQATAETLYSSSYMMQLIAYGLLTPFAEELLFRGVIYNRLSIYVKPISGMIWSAVVFGAYHGNMVQFIYGTICGIALAWLYERYGSLKAPILAHICLNMTAIILSQYDIFVWIFENQYRMMAVTGVCAALSATVYVTLDNITRREPSN